MRLRSGPERLEEHGSAVRHAGGAPPRDASVRSLIRDLGIPFESLAADVRAPVKALVIELLDTFDPFHELVKGLELGPLVIGHADGNVDVDRFFLVGHGSLSLVDAR